MAKPTFKSERTRRWFERLNQSNHMLWLIFTASFLETIIVPIPIELVLIPLMMVNRDRIWLIATVTMGGCLLAAIFGYGVGMALYQSVGTWFIESMGYQQAYESFQTFFDQHGFMAILLVGILPIPFQVAMITAGLSGYPLVFFVLATLLARGIRYYGLAWLVRRFGDRAKDIYTKHALASSLVAGGLVIGFYFVTQFMADKVMA